LGPPRRVIIAHVDALAPHKDEVTEAEDAEWDAAADNDDLCAARFRLPPPASTPTADIDNDAVQSPPPLNLPRMWTLGAPAPSEDLGTPLPTGTGVRQTGRVRPRARLALRSPPTRTHSRLTRTKPRKRRTPHKDEATEAEDAEWDPDNDEDPRVK
jgi:hypothetical protein